MTAVAQEKHEKNTLTLICHNCLFSHRWKMKWMKLMQRFSQSWNANCKTKYLIDQNTHELCSKHCLLFYKYKNEDTKLFLLLCVQTIYCKKNLWTLICQSRKSAMNNINDGWIFSQIHELRYVPDRSLEWCPWTFEWNWAIVNVISSMCAFPAMTSYLEWEIYCLTYI